jgi:hypothetical protein
MQFLKPTSRTTLVSKIKYTNEHSLKAQSRSSDIKKYIINIGFRDYSVCVLMTVVPQLIIKFFRWGCPKSWKSWKRFRKTNRLLMLHFWNIMRHLTKFFCLLWFNFETIYNNTLNFRFIQRLARWVISNLVRLLTWCLSQLCELDPLSLDLL